MATAAKRPDRPARAARAPSLPPLSRPATSALAAFTAIAIAVTVTFAIYDTDVWNHLAVGRAIWALHRVPTTQIWTWPTYGAPNVLPSWLFVASLWPVWKAAGVSGLFAWRWVTTLAAFALLWVAARRMGARGAWALFALFWCALLYRYRSQPRPETLVAILMAAQVLVLESRRRMDAAASGLDPAWALVPIAWLWANLHPSYWVGFALSAFYFADTFVPGREGHAAARRASLVLAVAACIVVSFANPFGWQALAEPFRYWLYWRHEPIYQIIGELRPVNWAVYSRSLLPAWLAALALLAIRHWRRHGFDLAQLLVYAMFVEQGLATQRFLSYAAILTAPFFARDLDEWLAEASWPAAWRTGPAQAGLVALFSAIAWLPTLGDPVIRPGWGLADDSAPRGACDWIRDHGVRGRCFHPFERGGYLLYRFWPEKDRLPFMDIHQAGTTEDRAYAALALAQPPMFVKLDDKYHFDWMLLDRVEVPGENVLESATADSAHFALVYLDDVAALYLRRQGPMAALAAREGFRLLPAGEIGRRALLDRCQADSSLRAVVRADLERAAREGAPRNGTALDFLAWLDLADERWAQAREHLLAAQRAQPSLYRVHERIGIAWLMERQPGKALAEFQAEQRAPGHTPLVPLRLGQAYAALGRRDEARAAYTKALEVPLTQAAARESLAALH
jgi:hypothetical protein